MNRIEFINTLRRCLTNKLSPAEIEEHVAYYEEYINMQIKKGMPEAEVLKALGEPRFLAKSILAARTSGADSDVNPRNTVTGDREEKTGSGPKVVRIPFWLVAIVVILLLIIIVVCLLTVAVVALKILIPIILILFLVRFIMGALKNR